MEEHLFELNANIYSNNNNILYEITNLLNQMKSYSTDDLIRKGLEYSMSKLNYIINENKKNLELIKADIFILYNKLNTQSQLLKKNNKDQFKFRRGKYIGQAVNGLPEGKGIWFGNNGDKYEGEWKNGLAEGKGIRYYKNGERYEGNFINDLKEGKGIFYFNNGDKYDGEWKNDKKEGKGIYYYNNGYRYEGDYKNDKKEGSGVFFNNKGGRKMGDYSNGEPIGKHVKLDKYGRIEEKDY